MTIILALVPAPAFWTKTPNHCTNWRKIACLLNPSSHHHSPKPDIDVRSRPIVDFNVKIAGKEQMKFDVDQFY